VPDGNSSDSPAESLNYAKKRKLEKVQKFGEWALGHLDAAAPNRMEAPQVHSSQTIPFPWVDLAAMFTWAAHLSWEAACWTWFVTAVYIFPSFVSYSKMAGYGVVLMFYTLPMLAVQLAAWRRQIMVGRAFYNFSRWVATKSRRSYDRVRSWWSREKEEVVVFFGYSCPRYVFVGTGCLLALIIVAAAWTVFGRKKGKCDKEDPDHVCGECRITEQGGMLEYATSSRTRALLQASVFLTSLVSFGNLKWFRAWSPSINFLGWIGQLLPRHDETSGGGGCSNSPACVGKKASGEYMCSECAVARATRQLHNPRVSGPGAFKPEKSYNSLCEDIITKANIDWYLTAPLELRQCIVDDEEVRKDIEAGKVKISVDRGSGKPFIRSLRDPMMIAALSHMKMYVSAGLLRTDLTSDEIEKADLVSSEMGIGFISKEQVPVEEKEVDEKCDSDESFHPLPRGADPDLYPQKTYWLFLKDGVWTAWRGMPITMASWKREFITWKNVHPILSKVLDVTIVLTSMIIVYLAYTASYDMVASWLRPWWRRFTEEDVELEGRGMKNRHVARAEGKGNFKSRAIPVAEQYQRGPRQEESVDDFNIPREKTKNYIFYDIQDITNRLNWVD
jgi:hypothetical protein